MRSKRRIDLEIITSSEEAQLAFVGCMLLLDTHGRHALVFDIGSGSIE